MYMILGDVIDENPRLVNGLNDFFPKGPFKSSDFGLFA
jgi:hypothetical protein